MLVSPRRGGNDGCAYLTLTHPPDTPQMFPLVSTPKPVIPHNEMEALSPSESREHCVTDLPVGTSLGDRQMAQLYPSWGLRWAGRDVGFSHRVFVLCDKGESPPRFHIRLQ